MAAMLLPKDGGTNFHIDKPIVLVGRSEDCDLCLAAYVKVSRRHCCVVHAGNRFLVRDLGSMNGIRVNGSRVLEQELEEGDEVAVADAFFTFSLGISNRPPAGQSRSVDIHSDSSTAPPSPRLRGDSSRSGASSDSNLNMEFVEV